MEMSDGIWLVVTCVVWAAAVVQLIWWRLAHVSASNRASASPVLFLPTLLWATGLSLLYSGRKFALKEAEVVGLFVGLVGTIFILRGVLKYGRNRR